MSLVLLFPSGHPSVFTTGLRVNVVAPLLRLMRRGSTTTLSAPSYTNGLNSPSLNTMALNGAGVGASYGTRTVETPIEQVMVISPRIDKLRLKISSS